ncbi:MAG TPA: spermidine/putrescine ABC transporter substrate-binding protein [Anaerolineales bacterium]|nr:spermidine/putrescine ABC transporter substrate-binding protein [Anaerolineales bacterium]
MNRKEQFKMLAVLVIASMVLAACGGGAAATATQAPATQPPAATEPPATEAGATASPAATQAPAATGSGIFASDGFECPAAENKMDVQSKELNLFVWTEYIPQDMQECFEKVYGIKVNRDEYSANEEMYAKLSAGGTAYDLVQPTDYIVGPMVKNGLIQKLDHSKLPVLANFDPNYLNLSFDQGNEYTIPYEAGTDAIVYNADKVTTPPQSFADLWKPEYAGKMVMLDDSRATIGATLLTLGYDVNTKDPKQLDEAKAKLKELVPNVKLFDSDSPKTALIAGDVDLGMTWTGEAFLAQQEVPSIQYVYPTEGAILWQDNWAMPTDAPHPDAAYAWLNYTMQGNVFWMMLRDFPYTNPNKAALDYANGNSMEVNDVNGNATTLGAIYDAYMKSPITNTPPEAIQNGHRIEDVGDALPLYDQLWTEVKGQ